MKKIIPKKINKSIKQIKSDKTSGSVELAKKSAKILIDLSKEDCSISKINNAAKLLVEAQPAMTSIFNLANHLLFYIDKNKNKILKDIVKIYCENFIKELETSDKKISRNAMKIIKDNSKIITNSYSSTVFNTLISAKKSKKNFSIVCTESRPNNEGVKLSEKLGKNKIDVRLIVDSAVFSFINHSDVVLVGGDSITDNYLINKIGTKGIAISAKYYKIPVYALCSKTKFLPKKYNEKLIKQKNPNEIKKQKLENVTPINYYFEETPLELLKGIVTEEEILKPSKIKEEMTSLKIHNILKART